MNINDSRRMTFHLSQLTNAHKAGVCVRRLGWRGEYSPVMRSDGLMKQSYESGVSPVELDEVDIAARDWIIDHPRGIPKKIGGGINLHPLWGILNRHVVSMDLMGRWDRGVLNTMVVGYHGMYAYDRSITYVRVLLDLDPGNNYRRHQIRGNPLSILDRRSREIIEIPDELASERQWFYASHYPKDIT